MRAIKEQKVIRFWHLVAKPTPQSCWPWLGGTHQRGYGRTHWNGQQEQAHRIAWQIEHGPIEPGYEIVQTCGDKLCCNPAHLVSQPDKCKSQAYLYRQLDRLQAQIERLEATKLQIERQLATVSGETASRETIGAP